ncbi:hypothetical protein CAXC1_300036 [Candidatus Xenohaliotis californiensis]|uniref:RHS Repeat protein n=1 Tax=Candidatus Xenohaliotis californiensis TaxID=84677 RepID=A0ABP0ESZ5_9RICK|nr:hypothetical protein CAXC1_300036 [Candidatus Xenohaliotis californiensis]
MAAFADNQSIAKRIASLDSNGNIIYYDYNDNNMFPRLFCQINLQII